MLIIKKLAGYLVMRIPTPYEGRNERILTAGFP